MDLERIEAAIEAVLFTMGESVEVDKIAAAIEQDAETTKRLPFCVIYGFGVFIACYLFAPIQHNYAALYVWGCIGATVFEYIVAMAMMKLFGEVWWNYDHLKFNYKGILCLESTLAWGLLALIIFGYFNIRLESFVMHINHRYVMIMGTALPIMYVTDFTYHFITRLRDNRSSMAEFQEDADKVKEIKKC